MTLRDYTRAYNATMREITPNPAKTLKGWQKDCSISRRAVALVRELYEKDREEILRDYSSTKAAELLAKAQEEFTAVQRVARDGVKAKLEPIIESKRQTIRAASAAPSEADIRLLQALSLRSNLTESDVIHAAEQLGSNLVSLGTLADIAGNKGINLPIPTAERLEEELEKAERFARDMVNEIDLPDGELSYAATCFYNYPDLEDGPAAIAFSGLDNSAYTAEAIKERIEAGKMDMKGIVNPSANAVEVELREGNSIQNIAYQFGVRFDDIEAANPGVDIHSLHAGDKIIIPGNKMKNIGGGAGFASVDQIKPVEIVRGAEE